MKGPPVALPLQPVTIFAPHVRHGGKLGAAAAARIRGGDGHGLELEEGECGAIVRDADEGEGRVWDVEDVFVEIVHLGAVRDERVLVCFLDWDRVVMERA